MTRSDAEPVRPVRQGATLADVSRRQGKKNPSRSRPKTVALYHDMRVHEDFHQCAQRLFEVTQEAARRWPDAKRMLFLDVQGHRNSAGGFDHDAYEILCHFIPNFLAEFLSEVHTPLLAFETFQQSNDLPDGLRIADPPEGTPALARDENPEARSSKPTLRAIMNYLGLEEPRCLICWHTPVERAHAQPAALGGSNDIRNFALLCLRHHSMAPDVPDPNAFWKWIDRMLTIEGPFSGSAFSGTAAVDDFYDTVRVELRELYGWDDSVIDSYSWPSVMKEYWQIIGTTGTHFGIARKVSTHTWALDQALRRLATR